VRLDKSRIPLDKLYDPRLAKLEADICEKMKDETYRLHVCLHEAAHAIYMERAGIGKVIFGGPTVSYDQGRDWFDVGSGTSSDRLKEKWSSIL